MSDTEEGQQSRNTEHNSPSEPVEGACGGELGLRPSTPFSENGKYNSPKKLSKIHSLILYASYICGT